MWPNPITIIRIWTKLNLLYLSKDTFTQVTDLLAYWFLRRRFFSIHSFVKVWPLIVDQQHHHPKQSCFEQTYIYPTLALPCVQSFPNWDLLISADYRYILDEIKYINTFSIQCNVFSDVRANLSPSIFNVLTTTGEIDISCTFLWCFYL